MNYDEFIARKRLVVAPAGFRVDDAELNTHLFDFQHDVVRWALARGRAAIFANTGMGKTPMQLEWAHHVCRQTSGEVLILAPLAVAAQTAREGEKFGIGVTVCRTADDLRPGINVTNYDRLHHFADAKFAGVVLDESSILKGFDGATRKALTQFATSIPYRLACTATPAPNDLLEITNHAEFLDVMSGKEIIALFFTQDGNTTHKWRLKGHAQRDFWRWLASWSVAIRKPSDLGYDDGPFILPPLNVEHIVVDAPPPPGYLFAVEARSLNDLRAAQRSSIPERVALVAKMVNESAEPWVVWCHLNDESAALAAAIPDAVEVRGSDDADDKEAALLSFIDGSTRVLISKASICGHGLNLQRCAHTVFVGMSYSWEQYFQAVRRFWRFGQKRPVQCYVVTSTADGAVVQALQRKEAQAATMFENIVTHMRGLQLDQQGRQEMDYAEDVAEGDNWKLYLGDSVEVLKRIPDDSVGVSVFSPPFPGMYTYTNTPRDMGNVKTMDELIEQYSYLVPELLRVTMPGRSCCVHLTQAVAFKGTDGYIGIKDFRGRVIKVMEDGGWTFYGEAVIAKNPQVKAIRTKDRGLLFKTLAKDSAQMHMALNDYVLQFVKDGDNPRPITAGISEKYKNEQGWITPEEWIEWACGVWLGDFQTPGGIRETDVLNVAVARDSEDERHLCPLQLGVIERCVKLWSAPGDLVLDPFAGVGSTGYMALKLRRKFVGIELKPSYWMTAQRYLREAEQRRDQGMLFAAAKEA